MNFPSPEEIQKTALHKHLMSVLEAMDAKQIQYCLMRDIDGLKQLARFGEVDLLVHKEQFKQLYDLLAEIGFVSIPSWGHVPHHFFVTYVEECDCWFKLDVVTEVAYGQPIHALRTRLADSCLANRQHIGGVYAPSPADELVSLLLHCVLDKGEFRESRRQRIIALRHQEVDRDHLTKLLAENWSTDMTWSKLFGLIDADGWRLLLVDQKTISDRLTNRDRVEYLMRQIGERVSRRLNRWVNASRPRSIKIAILAPDGAGKSTLAAGISESFYFPTKIIYMGLYQKGTKDQLISRMPGVSFVWRLSTQWWRYLRARFHQSRRRLVIFDRYTYDALLTSVEGLSRLRRLRRWLLANACPAPDLVLLLDAPGELLFKRKGEHSIDFLEKQRSGYKNLAGSLPQMLVVDASQEAEAVRRQVTALIWCGYLFQQAGLEFNQSANAYVRSFGTKSALIQKY